MNSEVSLKMAEIKLIYQIDLFCGQKILYLTWLNYKELKLIIKINDEKKKSTHCVINAKSLHLCIFAIRKNGIIFFKGGFISESLSLYFVQFFQKNVPNSYICSLRIVIWLIFSPFFEATTKMINFVRLSHLHEGSCDFLYLLWAL